VPLGLARSHAVASGAGQYQCVRDVEDYASLSVRARLAAGLLTIEAWLGRHQVEDEGTTAVPGVFAIHDSTMSRVPATGRMMADGDRRARGALPGAYP
jgi:hypothetical protein